MQKHNQTAALMDAIYKHQRFIYDITRKYYLLGRDQLIKQLQAPAGGVVLEIGCGTGRNLIKAAKQYPDTRFYGLDISRSMLELAEGNIARAGLEHRIRLAKGDAASADLFALFGHDDFDCVFFSYALSMIPPWQQALSHAWAHVRPGGTLHLVDFGQQEHMPSAFKTLLHAWLRRFHVTPRYELPSVMRSACADHCAQVEFSSRFRGYAWLASASKQAHPSTACTASRELATS
nr:class I SAM-dependent methyltransferase [Pseudovibrio hongkongensis]